MNRKRGAPRERGERDRERGGRSGGKGRIYRKKVCRLCNEKVETIDYKDIEAITKFLTEQGKIIPRRISGNCATHQRKLSRAVKLSRNSAIIPFEIL